MNLEPKKKAEELFYKFFLIIDDVYNECRMHKNEAKQCALIAQKNLLNKLKELNIVDEFEEEVLFEINAL